MKGITGAKRARFKASGKSIDPAGLLGRAMGPGFGVDLARKGGLSLNLIPEYKNGLFVPRLKKWH